MLRKNLLKYQNVLVKEGKNMLSLVRGVMLQSDFVSV